MKALRFCLILAFACLTVVGCSKDDDVIKTNDFVVAFKNPSQSFSDSTATLEVPIIFSTKAPSDGHIEITYQSSLTYGSDQDYVTSPAANQGVISLPVTKGTTKTSFSISKIAAITAENPVVNFSIVGVELGGANAFTQGNTSIKISFTDTAVLGGTMQPEVGGPNEPNQVYISLSNQQATAVRRDKWDLGFYSGDQFRVKLNGSMYLFAAPLSTTNIDAVTASDVQQLKPKMDFLVKGSDAYVDAPSGDLNGTAIQAISATPAENPVYLLKLGNEISTTTPTTGSVELAGESRGFIKIRILREGGNYILQYAELNATTHKEVIIPKAAGFNFSFFSFKTESVVQVQPAVNNWDLNFTVKTETLDLPSGGRSAYGFSDYVSTNTLGGVEAYMVSGDEIAYTDFSKTSIDESQFTLDQRTIGNSWRKVIPPNKKLYDNRYYIIKDAKGNLYKLKFTAFLNPEGVRGYPEFKYELLQ